MKTETRAVAVQSSVAKPQGSTLWPEEHDLGSILERVQPFTMVPTESLVDLARVIRAVLTYGIPGNFVECGVWRGGSSFLMAELLRRAGERKRKVWLFDSFEGLPAPKEIDGPRALEYAKNTGSPWYFDNCTASLADVQRTAKALGLEPYTELVKGWFDQTLMTHRDRLGPIAVLRIDADWYDSVRCCLESLYDQVVDGGFIIFDDYYTYDGAAIAVHEFLGNRRLSHRLESVVGKGEGAEYCQAALFRKGSVAWRWTQQMYLTTRDLASVISPGETLILADNGALGSALAVGRRSIPFMERDGQYWGLPPDDVTAVRELERLRSSGASFIAFAWPALWWLKYYSGLRAHLQATARPILENDRLVVFDLRP